jgi:outer membrane protein
MKTILIASAAIAAASLLPAGTARAQDSDDLRVRVGAGAQLQPKYVGSDEVGVAPLFDLDFARGSNPFRFEAEDDSFGVALISSGPFAFGPVLNLEPSRKNSDVGAPVGKVKTTLEAGAFAEYYPIESIRLRGEVRKGIGGHDGLVGSLVVDHIGRDGDRYVFSVGPRLLLSNSRYQRAYFGVTPEAALATGLPVYRPDGGIHAVGLASGLSYQFTPKFGIFGFARYERLVGDAGKSPIVREFGSRNQLSGGIGLSYTFTMQR